MLLDNQSSSLFIRVMLYFVTSWLLMQSALCLEPGLDSTSILNQPLLELLENEITSSHNVMRREVEEEEENTCRDENRRCRFWKREGYCNQDDYKKYMSLKCKRSCGICKDECRDTRSVCGYWASSGYCNKGTYRKFMVVNCRKSCGLCGDNATIVVSTTLFTTTSFENATNLESTVSSNLTTTSAMPTSPITTIENKTTAMAMTSPIIVMTSTEDIAQTTVPLTTSPTITTVSTAVPCVDVANSCYLLAFACATSPFAREKCKFTCGLCQSPAVISTTAATTVSFTEAATTPNPEFTSHQETTIVPSTAIDTSTPAQTATSDMITSPELPTTTIPASANTTPVPCEDRLASCRYFPVTSCNNAAMMKVLCKKSCGLCSTIPSITTSPTVPTGVSTLEPETTSLDFQQTTLEVTTSQPIEETTVQFQLTTDSSENKDTTVEFKQTTQPLAPTTGSFRVTTEAGVFHHTTELATTQPTLCVDKYVECASLAQFCGSISNVTESCKKTCGVCGTTTTAATARTTVFHTTAARVECADTFWDCEPLKPQCNDPESSAFLSETCRETCGFCPTTTPTTTNDTNCQDLRSVCKEWSTSGFCNSAIYPQLRPFMETNCRKSCSFCATETWSAWSECSATCGGGKRARTLSCTTENCERQEEACATRDCASCADAMATATCIDYKNRGACTLELVKRICTATCELCGSENATVATDQPSTVNATQSTGNATCEDKHVKCANWSNSGFCSSTYTNYMTTNCPESCGLCGVWNVWSSWSVCSAKCGGGVQQRRRSCKASKCAGESRSMKTCNMNRCSSCFDQAAYCSAFAQAGKCSEILWKFMCRKSCKVCVEPVLPTTSLCADKHENCPSAAQQRCSDPRVAMLCPKSCLTCTPPCEDQLVVCPQYSQNCSSSFIRTNCPKMCKQCGVPVVTATNETTSTDICKDTNPRCPEFKTSGLCTSKNFYDACPLSCGKCTSIKIPLNECKDQLSSCGILVEKMQCTNSMVRRSCPQSCGLCTETTSAPVTVATPQVCVDSHSNCSRWSQLGQCQNTFIKSLCKSSCRNCGARNAVVATPACSDQLGANCRLLTSRCSEVSVKMLCQKSCGFCGVPSVAVACKDQIPESCKRVAALNACKQSNFETLCPVSCGRCTNTPTQPSITVSESTCVDTRTDCKVFLDNNLCNNPTIYRMCAKTCGCKTDTPQEARIATACIDSSAQCVQFKKLNYCRTSDSVKALCAKSCDQCITPSLPALPSLPAAPVCRDNDTRLCAKYKGLCILSTVARQCQKTCQKCVVTDQEGMSNTAQTTQVSTSGCFDNMKSCGSYVAYCSVWKTYMRTMCKKTCNACGTNTPQPTTAAPVGLGEWSGWSVWSECSKSCNDDPSPLTANSGGITRRNRTCDGGSYCDGISSQTLRCNKDYCPDIDPSRQQKCVDTNALCPVMKEEGKCRAIRFRPVVMVQCRFTCGFCTPEMVWGNWSACSVACGNGTQTQSLECEVPGACSNLTTMNTTRERTCQMEPCSVWVEWSSWSRCSSSCGSGSKIRMRVCDGVGCEGDAQEEAQCSDNAPCPAWSTWSHWEACSASCGGGEKKRTRSCSNGEDCVGLKEELDSCNQHQCTISWGSWESWSTCSPDCGESTKIRTRSCPDGVSCLGNSTETAFCKFKVCPSEGIWSAWGEYGRCSNATGPCRKMRRRICLNGLPGRGGCVGASHNTMECAECLVGMWEGWSSWSRCSTSCGSGVMSRERSCLNGTAGVSGCPGNTESFGQCNQHSCPAWSAWKPWSVCSASCGNSGVRARSRDCYDDSIGDIVTDSSCGQGAATEIETCGRAPCPVWSSWGRWGSCSVSCGVGWSERTRLCRNGTVGDMGCHIGKSLDKKVCNTWDCPPTCDVTELEIKNRTLTPDALFAASSEMVGCEAYNARLNGDLAWCPTTNDTKRWIQVDLTTPMEVTGISVQGFVNNNRVKKAPKYSWVSRFGVLYYDEATSLFDAVRDNAGRARLFSGLNSPVSTDNRHWNSIKSRIWKIQVLDTSPTRHGCLRFELLTCQGNPIMGRSSEAGSGMEI